jgi:hypothetical protein
VDVVVPGVGIVEVAGPQQFQVDELVRLGLAAKSDPREVTSDPQAPYYGAVLRKRTLLPGDGATLSATRVEDWITQTAPR